MGTSKNKHLGAARPFRERGQVGSRARFGLLEKHKDYVHRARDYRSKQDRLKKLREKAAFRNKDEFYHGMTKAKTKNGVEMGDRGNVALSAETVKLLKTQDVGYVRMQIAKDQKKIDTLRKELETLLPTKGTYEAEWGPLSELAEIEKLAEMGIVVQPNSSSAGSSRAKGKRKAVEVEKHITFAETPSDLETIRAGPSTVKPKNEPVEVVDLGWEEEDAGKRKAKSQLAEVGQEADDTDEAVDAEQAQQHRLALYAALSARLVRVRELRIVEQKLGSTLGLFGKGAAQKVRKAGWVEDESAPEDRNGERKRYERTLFKWKLDRKK
ncbi:small-subunit processome [Papiliotrema laurentii]|uniref:Small-subunit processome n=1 Tax=Papiliotrema laurentii TaxID=5418 RepID=A0AAD9CY00_PAPLA|nr:small-subunit processome [Papiliotrema laurentii]